jgi:hypothetical protein
LDFAALQPPRWLENPPLEDSDVNAEEEIKALQLALGAITKELSSLEAFASIDGEMGIEDLVVVPRRDSSEEDHLALSGPDILAAEQLEFKAWLEEVSSVAAQILDERDRRSTSSVVPAAAVDSAGLRAHEAE